MFRSSIDDPDAFERWQKRKQQLYFICKVHGISMGVLALALAQWTMTTASYKISCWLQRHRYIHLLLTLLGFIALLSYAFFHKRLANISRLLVAVVALLTVEANTIILIRPMVECTHKDIIYSAIATGVALVLFFLIAFIKHSLRTQETAFYTMWMMRLFVVTELGFSAAYAMRSAYVDLAFTGLMMFSYVVLLIYASVSMGSTAFVEQTATDYDYIIFATLNCCNALGVFSNLLLFTAVLRQMN